MIDKVIKTKRLDFDEVISLGGCCNAATQLQHRGKRKYSLPLDWTLMVDTEPLKKLPELVRTRFAGFCQYENLAEYEPPAQENKHVSCHVVDRATGFRHIHTFRPPFQDRKVFEESYRTIRRRVDRFYRIIGSAKHVLLVLSTAFTFETELIEAIYRAFQETFPSVEFEIVCIQFAAGKCEMFDCAGGNVHIARYERQLNIVYDNQLTAPEWCFMDNLAISGLKSYRDLRKKNFKVRLMYKLWMWLGRRLEKCNAGCANMRFRNFERY